MKRICLFAVMILSACASPNNNYRPRVVSISEPPLSQVSQKSIGETLVRQGDYTTAQSIKVESTNTVGGLGRYTIGAGYYIKQGEDEKSEYFQPEYGPEGGRVTKNAIADPFSAVQAYKDSPKLCGVSVFGGHVCKDNAPFTRTERNVLSANSFQQALIYSGRYGDKLRIGYREFSNSMARPAFNNEVEYDLSESNIIAYKGARLEVFEATNEFIKYKVISNFNKSVE